MTDLRERAPATAAMQKLLEYRGTDDVRELPFGIVKLSNEAMMWLRGARGELFMAERLNHLSPKWAVLHSVMVDRFTDIDHIVVGPPGVFPINTKRLIEREVVVEDDVFRVDGWKRKYLAKAEIEARRVDSILRRAQIATKVLPIIAISGATKVKVKGRPQWHGRFIGVADVEDVARKLVRRPQLLEPDEVTVIADLLSDSDAWKVRPADAAPPEMLAEFRRLSRGAGRYRFVNVAFAVAALSALAVAWSFIFAWTGAPLIVNWIGSLYTR